MQILGSNRKSKKDEQIDRKRDLKKKDKEEFQIPNQKDSKTIKRFKGEETQT